MFKNEFLNERFLETGIDFFFTIMKELIPLFFKRTYIHAGILSYFSEINVV